MVKAYDSHLHPSFRKLSWSSIGTSSRHGSYFSPLKRTLSMRGGTQGIGTGTWRIQKCLIVNQSEDTRRLERWGAVTKNLKSKTELSLIPNWKSFGSEEVRLKFVAEHLRKTRASGYCFAVCAPRRGQQLQRQPRSNSPRGSPSVHQPPVSQVAWRHHKVHYLPIQ